MNLTHPDALCNMRDRLYPCRICFGEEQTIGNKIPAGLKNLFLIHFIVGLLFGLGYLLVPQTILGIVGIQIQEAEVYRLLGAAMLGLAFGSWLAYREMAYDRVRIVVGIEVVWATLGTLVILYALIFTAFPAGALLNAIILAIFAVAFGYYYFRKYLPAGQHCSNPIGRLKLRCLHPGPYTPLRRGLDFGMPSVCPPGGAPSAFDSLLPTSDARHPGWYNQLEKRTAKRYIQITGRNCLT
jgi:hypothetical protein